MAAEDYGRVPLLPKRTLRRHHVFEPADTRFRAAMRARQALLREEHGWPMGEFRTASGRRRQLGNYISPAAAAQGANFITPEIFALARREIAYQEEGALVTQDRLMRNLLSSAPAVFNVFGALKLDLKLGTRVLRALCPDFVRDVAAINFEHSPARRHDAFTADRTAFDVVAKVRTRDNRHGFVGIELKLSESMCEQPARLVPVTTTSRAQPASSKTLTTLLFVPHRLTSFGAFTCFAPR